MTSQQAYWIILQRLLMAFGELCSARATAVLSLKPLADLGLYSSIFELQSRTFSGLASCFLIGPLTFLNTAMVFWRSPAQLFFTYIIPLIPFCLVFDGYISSFRTRTPEEVQQLINRSEKLKGWKFLSGREMHTFPVGHLNWIICVRE